MEYVKRICFGSEKFSLYSLSFVSRLIQPCSQRFLVKNKPGEKGDLHENLKFRMNPSIYINYL